MLHRAQTHMPGRWGPRRSLRHWPCPAQGSFSLERSSHWLPLVEGQRASPEDRQGLAATANGQTGPLKQQPESIQPRPAMRRRHTPAAGVPGGCWDHSAQSCSGDNGPMVRGLRRPQCGQAFPGKGGGRKTWGLSGHSHPRERAGPDLLELGHMGRHPA